MYPAPEGAGKRGISGMRAFGVMKGPGGYAQRILYHGIPGVRFSG
jgi:hypothetical protein